MMNELLKVG